MPRGDRTGPDGSGPMTGRAAGYCAGFNTPGFANFVSGGRNRPGRFFNRSGRGRGRGFRNMNNAWIPRWMQFNMGNYPDDVMNQDPAMTVEQETAMLKNEEKLMQEELNSLKTRIQELEKMKAAENKSGE